MPRRRNGGNRRKGPADGGERESPSTTMEPVRLQAYLARAGVASRRGAEALIEEGRVTVNGRAAELGMKVDPSRDIVRVDHRVVTPRPVEWIALHKPRGYVTTRDDPEDRKTIYDLLPDELHHLFHVGRLDRDSSGLLLLTNDGNGANRLLHPRYGTPKEYRADVEGHPSDDALRSLIEGVRLEDGIAQAISVESRGEIDPGIHRLVLVVREGRNREVRRMFEAVGHPVKRLFRRSFGPIEIGKLKVGAWRRLSRDEVAALSVSRRDPSREGGRKGIRKSTGAAGGGARRKPAPSKPGERGPSTGAARRRSTGPGEERTARGSRRTEKRGGEAPRRE